VRKNEIQPVKEHISFRQRAAWFLGGTAVCLAGVGIAANAFEAKVPEEGIVIVDVPSFIEADRQAHVVAEDIAPLSLLIPGALIMGHGLRKERQE
jgi:hypothetical protein